MTLDPLTVETIALWLGIAGLLILVAYAVYRVIGWLQRRSPSSTVLLDALTIFAHQAVIAGVQIAYTELAAVDKIVRDQAVLAIAKAWYARLPATITIDTITIPIGLVKLVVTQAMWDALVTSIFNQIDAEISANESWLLKQIPAAPPVAAGQAVG